MQMTRRRKETKVLRDTTFEVTNTDTHVQLMVPFPGIKGRDVSVHVRGRMLTISGVRDMVQGGARKRFKFTKGFSIDPAVDANQLRASWSNGVLAVTAPQIPGVTTNEHDVNETRYGVSIDDINTNSNDIETEEEEFVDHSTNSNSSTDSNGSDENHPAVCDDVDLVVNGKRGRDGVLRCHNRDSGMSMGTGHNVSHRNNHRHLFANNYRAVSNDGYLNGYYQQQQQQYHHQHIGGYQQQYGNSHTYDYGIGYADKYNNHHEHQYQYQYNYPYSYDADRIATHSSRSPTPSPSRSFADDETFCPDDCRDDFCLGTTPDAYSREEGLADGTMKPHYSTTTPAMTKVCWGLDPDRENKENMRDNIDI